MEDAQLNDLIEELLTLGSSSSWSARHGSVLTMASMLRHNPSTICGLPSFLSTVDLLKGGLTDEKVVSFCGT